VPLDPKKVNLAMASGLSAVCATCQKYWAARDSGIPGDTCTTKLKCGSPMAGDSFTDYDGPLKGSLHLWCFVCAQRADFGIRVTGRLVVIGACKEHVRHVERFRVLGGLAPKVEIQNARGVVSDSTPSSKRSLTDAINEVETYYAKREGREPDGV